MSRSQGFRSDTASAYKRSEFDKVLSSLISTWRGHKNIALWLVNRIRPTVTVELGVDSGFSLLSLALTGIGNVYGIDSYEGDRDASFGDTRSQVEASIRKLRLNDVGLIKGRFKEVAQTWKRPIDLLHIDGMHDYESVKQNFNNWFSFLSPDGVVLMHDTCARDFGIRRFFDGIELPKINLGTSNGLGVISRNTALLQDVARIFEKQLETGTHAAT